MSIKRLKKHVHRAMKRRLKGNKVSKKGLLNRPAVRKAEALRLKKAQVKTKTNDSLENKEVSESSKVEADLKKKVMKVKEEKSSE